MDKTERDSCLKALQQYKGYIDCDEIKVKEKIKQILLDNKLIIYALNNKELEEEECDPEDYYGVNILPYYMIIPVQSKTQNFLCYEVRYDMAQSYQYSTSHNSLNRTIKTQYIVFTILCHKLDIIDRGTGIPRHDLLAALVQDQFNWSSEFGSKIMLVSDVPSTVDNNYACRTLVFEQTTDNNVIKSINEYEDEKGKPVAVPRLVNKVNDFRDLTHG